MKRKLVVNDGRSEREVLLVGPIVIGRDPSCHISDLDPLLSRRHAEFLPSAKGLLVRDLGSRNGILVNGSKVPERMLHSGDIVQLGHLQLRYIEEELPQVQDTRHVEDTEKHESATMIPAAREPGETPTSVVVQAHLSDAMDVTMAPAVRRASPDMDATMAPAAQRTSGDMDVTMAPGARRPAPDVDTTRISGGANDTTKFAAGSAAELARLASLDEDDTHLPHRTDDDETMAPHSLKLAKAPAPDEAQLVVDAQLMVRSTSPTGHVIFGVRPETLVGGSLADAVAQSVRVLATAKGRPTLALFATRNDADKTIKMTFKAGQAVEPVR